MTIYKIYKWLFINKYLNIQILNDIKNNKILKNIMINYCKI